MITPRIIPVQPETVVRWHRAGFKCYWSWISRRHKPVGRPRISKELRDLIFRMVAENPTWGSPRIHAELKVLGFDVSERTVLRWIRRVPRNIWVGTERGLDRFRETPFVHFRSTQLEYFPSLIAGDDGSVWINSHGSPLMHVLDGVTTPVGDHINTGPLCKTPKRRHLLYQANQLSTAVLRQERSNPDEAANESSSQHPAADFRGGC